MDEFELFKECAKMGSSLPGTPRLRKHTDPECGSIYQEKIEAKRKSVSDYNRKLGKKPLSRLNSSPGLFRQGSINSSGRPSLTESENELEIYRVRSFRTKKRSIVYRADSYKIRKSPSIQSVATLKSNCASTEDIIPTFRVLVLGSVDVGKTCIIKQFLTSEYVGATPNEGKLYFLIS
ncbi:DgyrCDS2595 [Dimorphilus gyrociliatus]|uniref:DgyrCDS2595 n=1 Tax=Dimorphilus gyrociliatus TaxID=2664684 RepID=A0A7I8VDT9_9ANNE|nr:DgyrCDS2595 [Dimorphilus gyrociliatus]